MDDLLKTLAEAPLPAELSQIDDIVMAMFAARQRETRAISRLSPVVAVLALGLGYAGGSAIPPAPAAAASQLVLAETSLAPSTLLDFL